jgi:hypothetical protein
MKQKQPRGGAVFVSAGPTRLPDGLMAIGTTSCVTDQPLNVLSALHSLDFPFAFEGIRLCWKLLKIDKLPRTSSLRRSSPPIVMMLYSQSKVVSDADVE